MSTPTKEELILIALEFGLDQIWEFCKKSPRYNRAVCESDKFWQRKLNRDFPNIGRVKNPQERYEYEDVYETMIRENVYENMIPYINTAKHKQAFIQSVKDIIEKAKNEGYVNKSLNPMESGDLGFIMDDNLIFYFSEIPDILPLELILLVVRKLNVEVSGPLEADIDALESKQKIEGRVKWSRR